MLQQKQKPPQAKANGWYNDGDWLTVFPHEPSVAKITRQLLRKLRLYPTTLFKGHSDGTVLEANSRSLLRHLVDTLPNDEVVAMARLARLLFLVERDLDEFKAYSEAAKANLGEIGETG